MGIVSASLDSKEMIAHSNFAPTTAQRTATVKTTVAYAKKALKALTVPKRSALMTATKTASVAMEFAIAALVFLALIAASNSARMNATTKEAATTEGANVSADSVGKTVPSKFALTTVLDTEPAIRKAALVNAIQGGRKKIVLKLPALTTVTMLDIAIKGLATVKMGTQAQHVSS